MTGGFNDSRIFPAAQWAQPEALKRRRFTVEQIVDILRQAEGSSPADVCRQHEISESRYWLWKARYGGLSVKPAERLRQLARENARLRRLVAELRLEKILLQESLSRR